jgi:hypothetical protein
MIIHFMEWWCSKCQFNIFAKKDACSKCGTRRPGAPSTPTVRPGDWACSHCKTNNFAARTECYRCRRDKLGNLPPEPPGEAAPKFCVVCFEPKLSVVFMPCKHLCTCDDCSKTLTLCPMCRTAIAQKIPGVFVAGQ